MNVSSSGVPLGIINGTYLRTGLSLPSLMVI